MVDRDVPASITDQIFKDHPTDHLGSPLIGHPRLTRDSLDMHRYFLFASAACDSSASSQTSSFIFEDSRSD